MASICMPTQTNYQQFQLTNGNIMLLPNAHNQQQQQHVQQQQQIFNQQQQLQHIAPKTPLGNSQLQNIQTTATSGLGAILQKKKYTYTNMPYGEQIPSVARRNARERNRVKQVNNGFVNLRQHIPQTVINALSHGGRGASKKLSKVDTLRIAVEYIRGLKDLLDDGTQPQQIHHHFHSDESSNDGSCAYSFMGSPNSSNSSSTTQQLQQQQQQQQFQQMHSYHSEQSTSPTPSYSDSDVSYMQHIKLEAKDQQQHQHQQQQQQQHQTQQQQQQFKFEPFDSFSDDQGDDEELLDYISSWQEQ